MADDDRYLPGDAVVKQFGQISIVEPDGSVVQVMGVLLTFPKGPPSLPLSSCWNGDPLIISPRWEESK